MAWTEGSLRERLVQPFRDLLGQSPLRAPARAVYRFIGRRRGRLAMIDGRRVRFSFGAPPVFGSGDPSSVVQLADHVFTRAYYDAIAPGNWVADIGAFFGTYSVLAALRTGPSGRVFAFEPTPDGQREIRRVAEWNGFSDVIGVEPLAVCDTRGEAEFLLTGASQTNSLYADGVGGGSHPADVEHLRVRTTDLDTYFGERGRLPDVVKIDIEGAEFAALRGAQRILGSGATVLCEMHPYAWRSAGHSSEDLRDWLIAQGRVPVDLRTDAPVDGEFSYGPHLLRRATTR